MKKIFPIICTTSEILCFISFLICCFTFGMEDISKIFWILFFLFDGIHDGMRYYLKKEKDGLFLAIFSILIVIMSIVRF